jgi:hypothetical protein
MKLTPWEPDLRSIVDRIDHGDIDLQPDFQRQEVWQTPKKKRLIDTVLRAWSIPPIFLVETALGQLEVLDGQQRLASLRDFFHDQFAIDGKITPYDDNVSRLHNQFYSKLQPVVRRKIDQYSVRCFRITDYQPDEPSELFYRLNQPTMLTAGEQRNALYGPAREQLKELVGRFEAFDTNRSTLGFSNLRLAYDDIIARLLFFLEAKNLGLKSTEARISERFRSRSGFPEGIVARTTNSIEVFSLARSIAGNQRLNKASVLSWLIFFSRFTSSSPDVNSMKIFNDAQEKKFTAHFVTEASALFEDRASLRVTDVSSVVYRDFVLCYVYYFVISDQLPATIPIEKILNVEEVIASRNDMTFEAALSEVLNVAQWSTLL